ncbi:MAG TPA: multiheme c-type cytochrome [Thermoanaerobaculia bacterium]|nr:multiheme c-type cytochrome [Thermoanaerobaculia bacterium]
MKPAGLASWLAAAALAGVINLVPAAPAATQPGARPGTSPPQAAQAAPAGLYLGPAACGSSNCHGAVRPRRVFGVRQDEYFIWQKKDLHAQAYAVLFDDRSAVIARRMRLGPAAESQVCLDCHALAAPARQRQGPLEIEDGVSCERCHGPASGWLEGHRSEGWTHQQSVAAGLIDLRDLEVRSAVCLSCHLGGPGKTVGHELIAAGHPQLSFELDNYSEGMPAHWLPFGEKTDRTGLSDTHGPRAWAVGQAAAFRAELDQLARRARAAAGSGSGDSGWPELSELACDTCHHPLAQERWRTAAGGTAGSGGAGSGGGRPGQPRWSPARYAVLRHLITAVTPDRRASLEAAVERLAGQLAHLGAPPAEVAATAERASAEVAALIPRLDRAGWDDAQARRLLLAVADDEGGLETADYQSAKQAAEAVQTLVSHLLASDGRRIRSGLAGSPESLAAALQDPYAFDPARFAARLAQLGREVRALP